MNNANGQRSWDAMDEQAAREAGAMQRIRTLAPNHKARKEPANILERVLEDNRAASRKAA